MNKEIIEVLKEINKQDYNIKYNNMLEYLSSKGIDIIPSGGGKISNCYCAQHYKVISNILLNKRDIEELHFFGLLGYGQEFWQSNHELLDNGKYSIIAVSRCDSSD